MFTCLQVWYTDFVIVGHCFLGLLGDILASTNEE